jgi:hypothetical protein
MRPVRLSRNQRSTGRNRDGKRCAPAAPSFTWPTSHRKDVTAPATYTPEARQTHSERAHVTYSATKTLHCPRQIESTSPSAWNAASVSFCEVTPLNLGPRRVVVHLTSHSRRRRERRPHNDGMR